MKKTSVDRREFLVIGAAAAAGVAAGPLAIGRTRAVGKGEPIAPILAIGFAAAGNQRAQATMRSDWRFGRSLSAVADSGGPHG